MKKSFWDNLLSFFCRYKSSGTPSSRLVKDYLKGKQSILDRPSAGSLSGNTLGSFGSMQDAANIAVFLRDNYRGGIPSPMQVLYL